MAETTQFVSRISVKDLISAFESKSETVRVEFSRPRARSFGNVLNKNVIVRLNEFITLEDVEKGLTKLETDLNFYEVYNKAKHVAFQEQFFNILTSIANIENSDEDAPVRKKRLISRTQTLVSFLNQKLPTNINQVVESKPNNQYKYTTYASHIKASAKSETNNSQPVETQSVIDSKVQPKLYVENTNTLDVTDSGEEYIVSVKKLKENFQHKTNTDEVDGPPKQERVVKVNQKVTVAKSVEKAEPPKPDIKQIEVRSTEINNTQVDEKVESISVTKLRSLFEQRSSSKGLEVITVDKPQLTKNNFGGSEQNINNIPYTERNLGSIRLQRSVSGNYMNYSGLLKRVDINRSSSVLELDRDNNRTVVENNFDEDSDPESDHTLENENESVRIEEISSIAKDIQKPVENNVEKEHLHHIKYSENIQVKYSSNFDQKEDNTNDNVPNGKTIFTSKSNVVRKGTENISSLQGFEEKEIGYSKASIVNEEETNRNTEELTFEGVDEVEVNTGIADSENILEEENIATLEVAEDPQSASESDDLTKNSERIEHDKTTENELSFRGYDEEVVNRGTASNENVQTEENLAKLEATTEDVSQSAFISGTDDDDDEVIEDSHDNNSMFSSLHDLEDERERSLIEEVIESIDVEQTLADADLVVNPEDLKNADDEFEKLLENSQRSK